MSPRSPALRSRHSGVWQSPAAAGGKARRHPPPAPRGAECFLEDRPSPAFPEMVPRKPRPLGCPPSSGGSARSRGCGEDARCRPCSGWLWRWRRCSPKCHCAAVGGGGGVASAPSVLVCTRAQRLPRRCPRNHGSNARVRMDTAMLANLRRYPDLRARPPVVPSETFMSPMFPAQPKVHFEHEEEKSIL